MASLESLATNRVTKMQAEELKAYINNLRYIRRTNKRPVKVPKAKSANKKLTLTIKDSKPRKKKSAADLFNSMTPKQQAELQRKLAQQLKLEDL